MDTDAAKDDQPKKTRKVKKQVRKGDLPISSGTSGLDTNQKNAYLEKEAQMLSEDKLVADTDEKKNELETFIYELRNKLDEQYAEFASEEEKTKIREKLEACEVSYTTGSLSPHAFGTINMLTRFSCRTGYMMRVTIPPRESMSPRSTRSRLWRAPSCSDTSRRLRPSDRLR